MNNLIIKTKNEIPTRMHNEDAGADLKSKETCVIKPGHRRLISTGVFVEIPIGYVGYIMSRSGLSHKHGVVVLNAPGVIDSGYQGELFVNLINFGDKDFNINTGDRIAQLVIQKIACPKFILVEKFSSETSRGICGHGSTGKQ